MALKQIWFKCLLIEVLLSSNDCGDHLVDLDEFMWGCMNLRGGAKALGIAKLQCETKKIHKVLRGLVTAQKQTENLEKAIVMSEDGKTGGVVLLEKKKKSILKPAK
eukprot:TRINITY_DN10471_c1_g1_i2.p2 TRINITY_DN10471_c1_g1~~TRINITY_DN10471_c1_g1_i2.p2  ORF type:complete len:121 (-),score=13.40 TRINITY_DN10471_c1_g1_i2:207-524(-)